MAKSKEKITKEMPIGKVVSEHPETIEVFMNHGLHCVGCAVAQFENIEQGASAHGIDIKSLIDDLNSKISKPKKSSK